MGQPVVVPAEPTDEMLRAANHADAAAIWASMIAARPTMQTEKLVRLPKVGLHHRNPTFWSDEEVRDLVVAHHRQITVEQLRALIRDRVGAARTPSKSAIARAWQRLDVPRREPVEHEY